MGFNPLKKSMVSSAGLAGSYSKCKIFFSVAPKQKKVNLQRLLLIYRMKKMPGKI